MIIGKISEKDRRVRFSEEIRCNSCGKRVPGGLQASQEYYKSKEFYEELERFKGSYLCGICRDMKRRGKSR